MLYAIKANRQYKIQEDEKQKYINMGYKIATLKNGELIYEKEENEQDKRLAELEKENKELKKELEKLKKSNKGEGK